MAGLPDPFEGEDWYGWARFGRGPGQRWHRVLERRVFGELVFHPLCRSRAAPMPPSTVVMDYRWDPGRADACQRCWPPGVDHPGIMSDVRPASRE